MDFTYCVAFRTSPESNVAFFIAGSMCVDTKIIFLERGFLFLLPRPPRCFLRPRSQSSFRYDKNLPKIQKWIYWIGLWFSRQFVDKLHFPKFNMRNIVAEEWEKPYSIVRGFINARMSIALVRATNRCIRGSRTPASNMSNRFRWEGGAGLGLLKSDN